MLFMSFSNSSVCFCISPWKPSTMPAGPALFAKEILLPANYIFQPDNRLLQFVVFPLQGCQVLPGDDVEKGQVLTEGRQKD